MTGGAQRTAGSREEVLSVTPTTESLLPVVVLLLCPEERGGDWPFPVFIKFSRCWDSHLLTPRSKTLNSDIVGGRGASCV